MSEPKNRKLAHKIIRILVPLATALLMFIAAWIISHLARTECDIFAINDGWTAKTRGQVYENVTLTEQHFSSFGVGETLELSTVLPENVKISNPQLKFYSVHCTVNVYLDDELIYEYGHDYEEQGKMVGYGWLFAPLPENYAGKTIRIVFDVTEIEAFEGIPTIYIVDGAKIVSYSLCENWLALAIGWFLVGVGFIGMIISIIMLVKDSSALKMFCIMMFAFLIGIYTMCNGDVVPLFGINPQYKSYLEYSSLYFLVIPFILYFYDWTRENGYPVILKNIYLLWVGVDTAFFVMTVILQVLHIVHFPYFVKCSHILMIVTLLIVAAMTLYRRKKTGKFDRGLTIGFAIAVAVAMIELLRYNLSKYFVGFMNNKYNSTIGIAAIVIVLALFIDFTTKITRNLYEEAQNKLLEKLAYMDELTGLTNRRGIEEPLRALSTSKKRYSIVSLDMNLLKKMNDTYGHATGDRALALFAKKLKEAFPAPCSVARVGGDEFVVINPDTNEEDMKKHFDILLAKMEEQNKKHENVVLSTAYGYAFSNEADSPEKVFSLADARMYENKKKSKMERTD